MKQKKNKSLASAICSALGTLIIIILIIVCLPIAVPKFMGFEEFTVISGSMEPAIPVGSLVYVKETDAEDLKEGDVIAFYGTDLKSDTIITHRIVSIDLGEDEITTKGDANEAQDFDPVSASNVIGVVKMHIPVLGYAALYISTWEGKMAMIALLLVALVISNLPKLFEKN